MASIHFSVSPSSTSIRSSPSTPCTRPQRIAASSFTKDSVNSPSSCRSVFSLSDGRRRRMSCPVRSSLETAGPTVKVGQVTEVDKDTFWPIVKAAGEKTVVLDMYTQWCGPCKIIAPKFQELSEKYLDVVFLKLDCNQDNKPLAKELGIRVVPTFKILRDNRVVREVTGAKFDDLVAAIDAVRST